MPKDHAAPGSGFTTTNERYLDATLAAFLRYGISRTRMTDIAAEGRMSRTTAYRVLGTVEKAGHLLLERELQSLLQTVTGDLESAGNGTDVIAACAAAMGQVEGHPLFRKVRQDEPAIIGEWIVRLTTPIIETVTAALLPSFSTLATRGIVQAHRYKETVEMLVRIGMTCVLSPPRDGYEPLLFEIFCGHVTSCCERHNG
jgi:AcrR family transcriptional regulator